LQRGGPLMREGRLDSTPLMGDPFVPMHRGCIHRANMLMVRSTLTGAVLMSGAGVLVEVAFH
jgi:hypothetical protein